MEFKESEVQWIEYDVFEDYPNVQVKSFLRHAGVSEKPFFSLNASFNVSDHHQNVKVNRQVIQKQMQVKNLVFANQIHSDKIVEITKDNIDKNFDCDALVTKQKDVALGILHADCQATLLFDTANEIVAAVHAGWRGLCKNIYGKTIDYLKNNFQSEAKNIKVAISASLCIKHSEFKNYKKEFPKELWKYKTDQNHFDLIKIGKDQFIQAGVLENNIEASKECTYCNEKDFFSYRRDKKTGRLASLICLK